MDPLRISDQLVSQLHSLRFGPPVACVYNPLVYARAGYRRYIRSHGLGPREVLLLGMNPGPWGMAQTGVPFGEVSMVRDWLGINEPVEKPQTIHPKRPVLGLACTRSEVSGARLWGWARDRFGTPANFFSRFFVANYCPLCFMEESGRNLTPNKLPARERSRLLEICDQALRQTVEYFQPRYIIGVGRFAEERARVALDGFHVKIGSILHPSPASPSANSNWVAQVEAQFLAMGVTLNESSVPARPPARAASAR